MIADSSIEVSQSTCVINVSSSGEILDRQFIRPDVVLQGSSAMKWKTTTLALMCVVSVTCLVF
jgi:hypothetical protein